MAYICNDIQSCSDHIRSGNLVAFPTQTVYGLGANALDSEAILKIFQAKKRPLTDPVIVHVNNLQQALNLIQQTDEALLSAYTFLTEKFWPGPLTIICKAQQSVPLDLTAKTGFIGLRSPNHQLARQLIQVSGLPIAAPSANMFAHVSPTRAQHVLQDFKNSEFQIKVLDGGKCSFGIESTVVKLCYYQNKLSLIIMRKGGISQQALRNQLQEVQIQVFSKESFNQENQFAEAPGQLIKHYSPNLPTYILVEGESENLLVGCNQVVLIDFNQKYTDLEVVARRDLSLDGSIEQAINNLYDALRWSETQEGVCVVLTDLKGEESEFSSAIQDRIQRAASGQKVCLRDGMLYLI